MDIGPAARTLRIHLARLSVFYAGHASSTEASMANLYFEELQIGSRSAAGPYLVSKEEIIRFAKQYDPVPRHIDEQAAALSVFGGLTASGSNTFAIFILLTSQLQPHFDVLMGLGWDEVRLPNAVRPGDELDLETTVLEMRPSKSRFDRGIVRCRNLLRNQRRDAVLECTSNIFVARRPDTNAPSPS
jgi:acyl dehydratase